MDRLGIKKKLYAGMGDFAKQRRGQEMKKKYASGNPEVDRIAASQDEAVESAEMPMVDMKAIDMSGVDSGASEAGPAIDEAMAAMAEDEEMAKWMAKQKG